jgi:3-oxoacyl-[acyl-carrier protein] reductase
MNKLKGKVAIVTGASKGIGAALAKGLAEAGDHTDTEGTRRIGYVGSELAQQIVLETPLGGRFGRPDEVAPVVVFLASDDAAWLTGERISASGGVH